MRASTVELSGGTVYSNTADAYGTSRSPMPLEIQIMRGACAETLNGYIRRKEVWCQWVECPASECVYDRVPVRIHAWKQQVGAPATLSANMELFSNVCLQAQHLGAVRAQREVGILSLHAFRMLSQQLSISSLFSLKQPVSCQQGHIFDLCSDVRIATGESKLPASSS